MPPTNPPGHRLDVKINDQPARFIFDTGAGGLLITREAAGRLGENHHSAITLSDAPGMVAVGWTEKCRLTMWNTSIKNPARVGRISEGSESDVGVRRSDRLVFRK